MVYLSLSMLGVLQITLDRQPVSGFESNKVRALLAYLAVEADRPHSRQVLAGLFWPEFPNRAAINNLRYSLSNLRKSIGEREAKSPFLLIQDDTIQFNTSSHYSLDVGDFIEGVESRDVEKMVHAISLSRGPFLEGFAVADSAAFEDWILIKREQLNRLMLKALSCLADHYEKCGEYEHAQRYAWWEVELEPWQEEGHQLLMRALALNGQRSAALAQYEACRRLLGEELGVEPSAETNALYQRIADGSLIATAMGSNPPVFLSQDIQATRFEQPAFVACETELAKLEGFLKNSLMGHGQVAFITGEPGSGKTMLFQEFTRRALAAHPDLIVVNGKCNAYTGIGDPYLPFLEMLAMLTGEVEIRWAGGAITTEHARRLWQLLPDAVDALVEDGPELIGGFVSGAALLARARTGAPAHVEQLELLLKSKAAAAAVGATPVQQIGLFEQYTKVLERLAHSCPLLLFVDDLQWADAGSISFFYHLGRRLKGNRILIIGAYRPEEVSLGRNGERHPLEPIVLHFQRDFDEVPIDLDYSDRREFVEAYLDSEPNRLSPTFRETLFRHTNGHPLFTIELLRSLQESGDLIQDETGLWVEGEILSWEKLPVRVEAVIAERISRLPQELRRILEVASVEGEEFTAEVVAEVLDVEKGSLVRQISDQLDRKHHLVSAMQSKRLDGQRISQYRFQHHLFQTYFYGMLDNVERAYLHEAVGGILERFYHNQPGEKNNILVRLARHFQEAGLPYKAIDYLRRSGEKAELLSASEEAIAHFRKALELCVKMPDTLERDQIELGLSMALGAQLVATRGFLSTNVEQAYSRARQLCQELSDLYSDPRQAASHLIPVLLEIGACYGHQAQYQTARYIYDQVFALAQASGDPEAMMMAHWGPGYLLVHMGQFLAGRSHLERALEAYEPHKHQRLITIFTLDMGVSCLSWLSWALFFLGYPDQARQRSSEAIVLARKIAHPFSLAVALATASGLHSFLLDAGRTQDLAEEAIEICREKLFLFWLGVASTFRGLALAWQGEYKEGITQMREGEHIWRASGANIGLPEYLIDLADVLGKIGQVRKGLEVLVEARAMITKSGETIYEAELYRLQGDLILKLPNENQAHAEDCYLKAIEIAHQQEARILELRATTSMSRLLSVHGKRGEAREMLMNIYSWFTEGFDTPDLTEARLLLGELENNHRPHA